MPGLTKTHKFSIRLNTIELSKVRLDTHNAGYKHMSAYIRYKLLQENAHIEKMITAIYHETVKKRRK